MNFEGGYVLQDRNCKDNGRGFIRFVSPEFCTPGNQFRCEGVNEEKMIQVRHYMGFGVIDGGKDPLSDKRKTYGPRRKHPQISPKATGSFRVSIVEDSSLFRQLFRETTHNRFPSVEIYEAIDGEGALLQVETSRPNLIFMDIRLPGENGLQLTQRIKARYPNITVVILTGYDLPEYREASSQYADYFFSKDSWTTQNMFTWVDSILPTWG